MTICKFFKLLFFYIKMNICPPPIPGLEPTFEDNFETLDLSVWQVSNWTAPGGNDTNTGQFITQNVYIQNGMLVLKLTQTRDGPNRFNSIGGEIATRECFGHGIYEWKAKASSDLIGNPVSGSITGMFNYGPASSTEIDFEMEGNDRAHIVQMTSWNFASNPNEHSEFIPAVAPHDDFHDYKFIWTPRDITYFVDGVQVAKHTAVIPTTACPVMINHWGTNNVNWGGLATPGVDRFVYVKRFAYTQF